MRLERRFPLKGILDIRLVNQAEDELIGYIADISVGGFRATSEEPIAPDTPLTVALKIPVREGTFRTLSLPVVCKWSRRDSRLKRFNLGFSLVEPNPAFADLVTEVRTLIKLSRRSLSAG